MIADLFRWCTSLGSKTLGEGDYADFVDYYRDYFDGTPVCSTIFWTGLAIAGVIALLFYFGICNFVFKLAKRWVWFCALALVFVITFFVTIPQIVGHDADNPDDATGIFFSAYQTEDDKIQDADDEAREEIKMLTQQYCEQFQMLDDESETMRDYLPVEMALANSVYALLFFFILSLVFKRFTTHGTAIPF